ncbi:uncharacterized protein LOC141909207 [Tubulanus polymorphus]|uniref:uncharacterized protein LOC141909207 n=1 Tax=Tubulanus polymorphus TaxID=672921 RepID=UPI003DA427C0
MTLRLFTLINLFYVHVFGNVSVLIRFDQSLAACLTVEILGDYFHLVSSWLIVLVSFERFVVVLFPMKGRLLCTPCTARFITLIMCLLGFCSQMWPNIPYGVFVPGVGCVVTSEAALITYIYGRTIIGIVPMFLVVILNCTTVLSLFQQKDFGQGSGKQASTMKATVMLLGTSICFVICYSPLILTTFVRILLPHLLVTFSFNMAQEVGGVFFTTNNCINFYIYVFLGRDIRSVIQKICLKGCQKL